MENQVFKPIHQVGMKLPGILIQTLLLPILALILSLLYAIAWLREAMGDLALRQAPVVVLHRPRGRDN